MWAGVSDEFFHSATFPALGEVSIPETYSPIVGMSNVTDANENILINFSAAASGVTLEFFSIEPATLLRVTLKRGGSGEQVQLTITTAEGKELIAAETKIK